MDAPNDSLLDRVMHSQQVDTLEHFNAAEVASELLKELGPKEADVLRRRFGLSSGQPETLEIIGASYRVTRERVRQIQRAAVRQLSSSSTARQLLHNLDVVLQQLLEDHGGVILENELLASLNSQTPTSPNLRAATLFLLEELLNNKFERVVHPDHKPYWKLRYQTPESMNEIIKAAESVLRDVGKPLPQSELLERMRSKTSNGGPTATLAEQVILSYLSVATTIERNPFGEFGLREWGSIVPKRMNDKILLVLRKQGKPMHFQEITKRINEIGFDHRQAYPPTVHNELILNKEYVLIGRGIYALREWGYKPGVVADVIADILRRATEPLSREEVVTQVLAQRLVKRNTIHLALTNKKLFRRLPDGRYALVESSGSPSSP